MTISQPGIKSNIFYCHTGLVLMNAIATHARLHLRPNVSTLGLECRKVGSWMQSCVAIAFIKTKPVWQ